MTEPRKGFWDQPRTRREVAIVIAAGAIGAGFVAAFPLLKNAFNRAATKQAPPGNSDVAVQDLVDVATRLLNEAFIGHYVLFIQRHGDRVKRVYGFDLEKTGIIVSDVQLEPFIRLRVRVAEGGDESPVKVLADLVIELNGRAFNYQEDFEKPLLDEFSKKGIPV